MGTKTFTVPGKGIGRRDFSNALEFASQASSRGHQRRMVWTLEGYDIPTLAFPDAFGTVIPFFDEAGALVILAPAIPYHIYKVTNSSGRAALVLAGLYRFASLADAYIWNVERWYGDNYGYGKTELIYTNGIKTEEGKIYIVTYAEYSEKPTYDLRMSIDALYEKVIYG